ncbi:MAG: L,D-transpeptidase catalytic domain [Candidatus Udaeobacter sp.]|nr:MAG: L,D-transpeptidase catalytic domain [Candidatus Udaeobacter sp.]
MVIGLDSARKQLQWRLIYATFDVDSTGFAGRGCVFCQRSIPPGTEAATAESYPAANAQSVDIHSEAGTTKGESIVAQTGTPDNTRIVVSIPKQRAYLMIGDKLWPMAHLVWQARTRTPRGHFNVMEKDPNHHSSLYGDFVDGSGRVVRAGVSARSDSAPSGTHFAGAAMKWFLRLTGEGVGMHIGILPGYPASHGCIRESVDGAKLFYDYAKVGTSIDVGDY